MFNRYTHISHLSIKNCWCFLLC